MYDNIKEYIDQILQLIFLIFKGVSIAKGISQDVMQDYIGGI
jgi:hypothetical protein